MGRYSTEQLNGLFYRARDEEDRVLDAVVRNKLSLDRIVRDVEKFIDAHAASILKGGIREGKMGEDPSHQLTRLWLDLKELGCTADNALDRALERVREQT